MLLNIDCLLFITMLLNIDASDDSDGEAPPEWTGKLSKQDSHRKGRGGEQSIFQICSDPKKDIIFRMINFSDTLCPTVSDYTGNSSR